MKYLQVVAHSLWYALHHPWVKAGAMASALCLVAVVAVWGIYWRPLHLQVSVLEYELEGKRRATVESRRAADVAKSYRTALKQVELIEKKLNIDGAQARLVQHLGQLTRKHQVRIVSEAYEEGREQNSYKPLYLELMLTGDYASLRRFLLDLKTLPTWTFVQEASLSRSQEGGNMKARLRLITYYRSGTQPRNG